MGSAWLELATVAGAAFAVGLSGAMMPGPVLSVTLANIGRAGAAAGPLVTLGHGIVEALLVLALVFGAGQFLTSSPVQGTIAVAGALVLLWMGWGMIAEARSGKASPTGTGEAGSRLPPPVLGGALASLANPYWYLWWATVGFGSVALVQSLGGAGVAAFFTGHIFADLVWLSAVSFALSRGRRVISPRVYARIIGGLGAFLIVFAALFFVFGVERLL